MLAASKGKKALADSNYEQAIEQYTAALKESPTSPDYLIQRSTAYLRAKKPTEALSDANNAVLSAQKRAKREYIVEAQFRRGCALYHLERYADAGFVFAIVMRMDEKHKQAPAWQKKTSLAMQKLGDGDEKRKCTVMETPEVAPAGASENTSKTEGNAPKDGGGRGRGGGGGAPSAATDPATKPQPAAAQTPAEKIRYDWYQNADNVYFTLLAKGVPSDKTQIDIQERSLSISFPLESGSSYDLTLEPLHAAVVPEKCTTRILQSKVEIVLAKSAVGQKWKTLESEEPVTAKGSLQQEGAEGSEVKRALMADSESKGPAYPTSSKSGPKDWDKVMKAAQAEFRDPNKTSPADDDDEYEGGDEANHFFKKLFKDASPEVQRAMMKSYTESNGTALSTNWDEVKKAKVETVPPDGMEAKEYAR